MRDHRREKVALGVIHGSIHPQWAWSMLALVHTDMNEGNRRFDHPGWIIIVPGTNPATQRNAVVRAFLEGDADWLVFIDTDERFRHDLVEQLVASADPVERPIVSALIMARKHSPDRIIPACIGFESFDPLIPREYDLIPNDRHWKVGAVGAGGLIIHRTVLEQVGEKFAEDPCPWFKWMDCLIPDETGVPKPDTLGEDYSFCLKAATLGIPSYVDTTIEIGHIKDQTLTTRDFWAQVPFEAIPSKNYAVIPTKGKVPKYLKGLIRQLLEQGECDDIIVLDNGCRPDIVQWLSEQPVTVVECHGQGIHHMWNTGAAIALSRHPKANVAFLNDDIRISTDFMSGLAAELRLDDRMVAVCPNWNNTTGAELVALHGIAAAGKNDAGLSGWAFMVKGEWFASGYRFPEDAMWWFGDNDLTMTLDRAGLTYAMVTKVSVEHLDGGGKTGDWGSPRMAPQLAADQAAFMRRWPEVTLV